jgi:hypothetical protein
MTANPLTSPVPPGQQQFASGSTPRSRSTTRLLQRLARSNTVRGIGIVVGLVALVGVGQWLTGGTSIIANEQSAATAGAVDIWLDPGAEHENAARLRPDGSMITPTPGIRRARPPAAAPAPEPAAASAPERKVVTGSFIPTQPTEEQLPAEAYSADVVSEPEPPPGQTTPVAPDANRKLIRNAQVDIEVVNFADTAQQITTFTNEARGFIATTSSQRQANGKLRGTIVAKVLPEHLENFLQRLRTLGDVQNQTLGTEDVTKQYFDTDSRLNSARTMEQRLLEILRTKTGKVSDLLEVEKELGRVRAQIEEMQGSLKYLDAQVQFATVTIQVTEKNMDLPAAFVLKRRAQLALFSTDVEKTFAEVRSVVDGAKAQISSSTIDRDSTGEATARLTLLIVPEEADALIERIRTMGRVQNYNEQTDRIAKGGGSGMSDTAKVEHDKVELNITISRNEQEPALQTTSLRILTSGISEKAARLKEDAARFSAEVRNSSFTRTPDGQEFASLTLRVPMKNYQPLVSSFEQLGKVKDVSVQREDRRGIVNEETAPADIHVQVHSEPGIVGEGGGFFATLRQTLSQGLTALMWSLRMVGVALAFFAPWVLAIAAAVWLWRRARRLRQHRRANPDATE